MLGIKRLLGMLFSFVCLTGCNAYIQDDEQYYWGNYEILLYEMYHKPGSATPVEQIEKLTVDIEKAQNSGKLVAPGVYAHLGLMYAMLADEGKAEAAFVKEKELYPDASVLIDGMIARVKAQGQKPKEVLQ